MIFKFPLELGSAHLKVFSAIFSNLSAGFIVLAPGTTDLVIIISDIIMAVLCGIIAIKIEKILE